MTRFWISTADNADKSNSLGVSVVIVNFTRENWCLKVMVIGSCWLR